MLNSPTPTEKVNSRIRKLILRASFITPWKKGSCSVEAEKLGGVGGRSGRKRTGMPTAVVMMDTTRIYVVEDVSHFYQMILTKEPLRIL